MFDSVAVSPETALPLHCDQTRPALDAHDPRAEMARRLPRWLQPILTWVTAMPAPGERERCSSSSRIIADTVLRMTLGVSLSVLGTQQTSIYFSAMLIAIGSIVTTSGLGLVQVVIFHYCAHEVVFRSRKANTAIGRAISAIFLFEYFDRYKENHIQHHRARKQITGDDEFLQFLTRVCRLHPGDDKREMWRRLIFQLVSPVFHTQFFARRVRTSLYFQNKLYAISYLLLWSCLIYGTFYFGALNEALVAWALPLVVLLQIATVLRILCEHRVPEESILAAKGKNFICHATTGVFPGRALPDLKACSLPGATKWLLWWLDLVTVQLFVRLFVLVGDAPCHDFHHRRYGSRRWASAIYARQKDKEAGCPGYPVNYMDVWGLCAAIDSTLESLSVADRSIGIDAVHH